MSAEILLYGSFAATGGHGTDRALVAGLLGMQPDDMRIPDSFELARKEGLEFVFGQTDLKDAHPNSVVLSVRGENGRELSARPALWAAVELWSISWMELM